MAGGTASEANATPLRCASNVCASEIAYAIVASSLMPVARLTRRSFMAMFPRSFGLQPRLDDASQMAHLEFFARAAEIRKRIFQKIGQLRHSEQIGRRSIVVRPRRLGPQRIPVPDIAVAAAEPSHRDQIDLLILAQSADES